MGILHLLGRGIATIVTAVGALAQAGHAPPPTPPLDYRREDYRP